MVEMQIRQTESDKEKEAATIDITEIIGKVKGLVDEVRDISGKPMDVKVDSLNFSVGQTNGELNVSFNTKIAIKPK